MGCTESKPSDLKYAEKSTDGVKLARKLDVSFRKKNVVTANEIGPPTLDKYGNLTSDEVLKRIQHSPGFESIKAGEHITLQYAYLTQRGHCPKDLYKPNQDSYSITQKLAGVETDCLFGVYDGHGVFGQDCAKFCKDTLPSELKKFIRRERMRLHKQKLDAEGNPMKYDPSSWPMLKQDAFEEQCRKAFISCNDLMHGEAKVKDNLSGTTAITAAFQDSRLTICNVGDSRAIIGQSDPKDPKNLIAKALSKDQTPFRKDERNRIKRAGARCLTLAQLSGKEPMHENWIEESPEGNTDIKEDPPRVWVSDGEYPGTAFTRSIGDRMAEDLCGVHAEPEFFSMEITPKDRVIVLCSDGVFEFITNQEVMNICAQHDDPLEACRVVAAEAYKKWTRYDLRVDDITIMCLFIETKGKKVEQELTFQDEALPQSICPQ